MLYRVPELLSVMGVVISVLNNLDYRMMLRVQKLLQTFSYSKSLHYFLELEERLTIRERG